MQSFDRYRILILAAVLLSVLYLVTDFRTVPDADATGGAFKDTKHGGGTVDGFAQPGVNRAINFFDFDAFYYNDPALEAGEYNPGECAHCHEAHDSFGGSQPPPIGGPNNYLLFQTNDNLLCWYCHEEMSLGFPPQPFGYGSWGFYQGRTNFEASSHGTDAGFRWPGDADLQNDGTIWPRNYARPVGDANKCINCHTPHGVTGTHDKNLAPAAGNYSTTSDATSDIIPRQLIAREEALCLNCHDSGGPANAGGTITTNIKEQVDYYLDPGGTAGSGHPVRSSTAYNVHDLANEDPGALSSGWLATVGAHAECTDCHNPHVAEGYGTGDVAAQRGTVFQWSGTTTFHANRTTATGPNGIYLGKPNSKVWGVSVSDVTTGTIGSVTASLGSFADSPPNYVYELCLKCHSYWAWGDAQGTNASQPLSSSSQKSWPAAAGGDPTWTGAGRLDNKMTDVAYEFRTNNVSYHPVFDVGKNRPESVGIKNPCWCNGYTCDGTNNSQFSYPDTGCDQTSEAAAGTRADLTGADIATLSQTFVPPWKHTSLITCVDCHEADAISSTGTIARGPHGSSRPFILRRLDTNISYNLNPSGSYPYSGLSGDDLNVFCFNCHRADVYESEGRSGGSPRFSRVPHPVDCATYGGSGGCRSTISGNYNGAGPPNGIVCMGCHGGSAGFMGGIHGSNITADISTCPSCTNSARLIIVTGVDGTSSDWITYTKAAVGASGTCAKASALGSSNFCGHGSGGNTSDANYNY